MALALVASTAVISVIASQTVSAAGGSTDAVICAAPAATSTPHTAASTTSPAAEPSDAASSTTSSSPAAPSAAPQLPAAGGPGWLSGSDNGSSWKQFRDWRGGMTMAGTWTDAAGEPANQQQAPSWILSSTNPQAQWKDWDGPMDVAIGGMADGHTWAQAATGGLDAHWTAILSNLRDSWSPRDPGDLFIRPFHEFNGTWFQDWSVGPGDVANFKTAWTRFRSIQRQILPTAHLVWSPTAQTMQDYDVRDTWPGGDAVDVIGVDWYNFWPHATTADELAAKFNQTDRYGAPVGLEKWRQFAAQVDRPLAVPEWANSAVDADGSGGSDAPEFIAAIHSWFAQHAGNGGGQLLYEIYFNVSDPGFKQRWYLFDGASNPSQPRSAALYQSLFGLAG